MAQGNAGEGLSSPRESMRSGSRDRIWVAPLRKLCCLVPGADALLALGVGLAVLLLHVTTDAVYTLERRYYDAATTWLAPRPSDRVMVIAIDDPSIAQLGRWPWPRELHARLIDRLALGQPRAIVHTALFLEPEAERSLDYLRRIQQAVGTTGPVGALLAQAAAALDGDAQLAASLRQAEHVLLPAALALGAAPAVPVIWPAYMDRSLLKASADHLLRAQGAQFPLVPLGEAAAGVGHLSLVVDADGVSRADPVLIALGEQVVPSLALLAAAAGLGLGREHLAPDSQGHLHLGAVPVSLDAAGRVMPQFYPPTGNTPAFALESAHQVLAGQVPPARFTDRVVIIGPTAAGIGGPLPVPGYYAGLTPPERLAHSVSSLMAGHGFTPAPYVHALVAVLSLAVLVYLAAGVSRLRAGPGALITALMLGALLVVEWLLLLALGWWVPMVFPAVLLVLGHLALTTRRFLLAEKARQGADQASAEAHRVAGLALLAQGQLDLAFDRFRLATFSPTLMDNLYQLALDFERHRQFGKADSVYAHMASHDPGFKDLAQRRQRVRRAEEVTLLGSGALHPGGTLVLDDPTLELPTLGRYRIDRVLGQGSMGTVYLGHDPTIGRAVALKTLALSATFQAQELAEARERFFREAESAGRLAHPHIVTLYDAGEAQDLAYLALEFVPGEDLSAHARPGALLPVQQVVEIGRQVASALDYAHRLGVVHRDIKPGNLLWLPQTGQVKVSDFGIALLMDRKRTRTGTLLGTPGYMAPEQIAGQLVDGRSDLYALGATLYQLLTGSLPFEGESIAQLMYRITHMTAPDIRSLRPDLPAALAEVIARCLRKVPAERPTDGAQLAADLQDVHADATPHG